MTTIPVPLAAVAKARPGTALVRVALGAAGAALCVAFALLGPRALSGPDDALILVVYMIHLVHNGVIAWNLHDGHVDGCTSILDLLVKSGVYRVTGADPLRVVFWVTIVLHVLIGVVALVVIAWLTRGWSPLRSLGLATLGGLLLATSPALADGASFLLETPLFVLASLALVATFLLRHDYPPWMLAALVLEATAVWMARPEGLPLATAFLAVILFEQRRRLSRGAIVLTALAYAGIMAGYFTWHVHYFGYWAPNTYYAKTSSVRLNEIEDGWDYVVHYGHGPVRAAALAVIALAPFTALSTRWVSSGDRARFALLQGAVLGSLAVVVYSGGDGYSGGRFLALPLALSAFALAYGVARATGWLRGTLLAAAILLAGGQAFDVARRAGAAVAELRKWPLRAEYLACPRRLAGALRRAIPRGSVAEADFQTLKYVAEDLEVIDLHGLNDQQIAHRPESDHVLWGKFNYADALRLQPDAWFWGHTVVRPAPMAAQTTRELITDHRRSEYFAGLDYVPSGPLAEQMVQDYVPASYAACGSYFNLLVRKDLAARFAATGFMVGSGG